MSYISYLCKCMKNHFSLFIISFCLPFVLWAACGIMPTFDDYTSLQSTWWVQIADPGYFFADVVRRPFDALLGAIVGWQPALFPTLNHVLIILGHTASAWLVYALCQRLLVGDASKRCSSSAAVCDASKRCTQATLAANIATLFFFFSPATLGATLACDGFNQTYAQLWGLLSLWLYLRGKRFWLACVVMAVLSKENGLAWAVVPPIVGYAFGKVGGRQALRHIGYGLAVALVYFIVYFAIYKSGVLHIEYDEQYTEVTLADHLKDFIQLMGYTWIPLDYMSIVYAPTRNLLFAAITLLLSLPFLLLLAVKWRLLGSRQLLLLIACFFILVSPHLVTVVSIMHNYAALSMAAFVIACIVSSMTGRKHIATAFALFMAAALFTDAHHYLAARQSGLLGQKLAHQAINVHATPPAHVFCINIDDPDEPRYSSFVVRPVDAFAWGLSVRHFSHYSWKTHIDEISLPQYDQKQVEALADSALRSGSEAVWVVGHKADSITILTAPQ